MKNKKYISIIVIVTIILTLISISSFGIIKYKEYKNNITIEKEKEYEEQRQKEILEAIEKENIRKLELITSAEESINLLYSNDFPRTNITEEEFQNVEKTINLIEDKDKKELLLNELEEIRVHEAFYNNYTTIYQNGILIEAPNQDTYDKAFLLYELLNTNWQSKYTSNIKDIKQQKTAYDTSYQLVRNLFTTNEMKTVKANVTKEQYKKADDYVNTLKNEKKKKEYKTKLEKVNSTIDKREEEKRKQQEIKDAWVVLDTPYISQNYAKIYNGCEGASLLMAAQYKGYLRSKTLKDVAEAMPKSDDPHKGFYLDIYGVEPRSESHWIAPDALTSFARSYTGNSKIFNATGYSFKDLENELKKGNPVIIYVTGGSLATPIWVEGKEVPKNLHVILLVGYNPISKHVIVKDPWTHNSSSKYKYYSESRITSIYNQVGRKSVVVP